KVNVVMRYAPLHKGSNDVVKMLEAAHLQGQFWPALELLFANQQRWVEHHVSNPSSALAGIKTLNVDHDQLDKDWQSSKIEKIVAQDIQDGQTLKVRATPQFFVNGKPLVVFGYEELMSLVEQELAEAY
ncbi:MAG TPA: thioredoxin, partial [Colwellia sp.]|nr:thioredoxin [Colwellia sp.]